MTSPWLKLAGIAVVSEDLKLRIIKEWPSEPAIDGRLGCRSGATTLTLRRSRPYPKARRLVDRWMGKNRTGMKKLRAYGTISMSE
ncbi:hypothetical protein [Candidatus Accumulibacter vicinus]|uniref:hypothetical protein n=1 Tax=Candidatus Accumulibacter vicinus TaxID=2954382 RepID=UPI00235B6E3E|nr:hypothetical protein [Candidatus Accumulibacter vicinus]